MDITITFGAWLIPTIITVVSCGYAIFGHDDGGGMLSGIGNIILLVPALFISLLAWILWGILT